MSPDIQKKWRPSWNHLATTAKGGPEMLGAGKVLGYWPDSGLPDSLIPGFLESKKALKEASDPLP